jgi:hypothetical protein
LNHPAQAQVEVLERLLQIYQQTGYGKQYQAARIGSIDEYRHRFPIATYEDYKPWIERVMQGETTALLNEQVIGWAITRGTTKGDTKFIPMTPADLKIRVAAGRAMLNYVVTNKRFDLFKGVNLNLNFPSEVGKVKQGQHEMSYGYSSGIYAKHVSALTPIRSVPSQDEIDALGGGKTIKDWENRFDLAYEKCKGEKVTLLGGVAPTALDFGRYLYQKHKLYPRDIWDVQVMTLGSVPGINTRLAPALRAMYGKAAIREIYGATEGMFGQQMDEKRAWVPNYDLFFFEVKTSTGIKLLHDMQPDENGSLIVSTPVLARYEIGDIIRAYRKPYFRCIGRQKWWTGLKYIWDEMSTFNLGRL